MSTVNTDAIKPRDTGLDITLGAVGDTTVISADSINANTIKDSGGNTLWTSDGSGTLSSLNSAFEGNLKLLTTTDADASTEIVFTNTYINSTYDVYIFRFFNMHSSSDTVSYRWTASEDNGSSYGIKKTTTYTNTWVDITSNSQAGPLIDGSYSQGNTTTDQALTYSQGNDDTYANSGELWLFSPSTSTSVTHFMTTMSYMKANNEYAAVQLQGYFGEYSGGDGPGTTIDAVKFLFSSGNIDTGRIKLYGIL